MFIRQTMGNGGNGELVISHQAASKKNPQTKRLEPKNRKKKITDYRHPVPQQFPLHTFQVDGDPHFFLVIMGRRRLWFESGPSNLSLP